MLSSAPFALLRCGCSANEWHLFRHHVNAEGGARARASSSCARLGWSRMKTPLRWLLIYSFVTQQVAVHLIVFLNGPCPAEWITDSIFIPPFCRDSLSKQHEIIPSHEGSRAGKDSMKLQIAGLLLVVAVAYATIEGEYNLLQEFSSISLWPLTISTLRCTYWNYARVLDNPILCYLSDYNQLSQCIKTLLAVLPCAFNHTIDW